MAYSPSKCPLGARTILTCTTGTRLTTPLCVHEERLVHGGQGDGVLGGLQLVAGTNPRDVRRVHLHVQDL